MVNMKSNLAKRKSVYIAKMKCDMIKIKLSLHVRHGEWHKHNKFWDENIKFDARNMKMKLENPKSLQKGTPYLSTIQY